MSLKYVSVLGEQRVSGFGEAYQFCDAPLDKILLDLLENKYGFLKLPCSWSQLDHYDLYLDRQNWIRDKFALVPLDTEFRLWLGQEAQLRQESDQPS